MLVVECDVLETILSTILHLLQDFIRDGILKLTSRYKHNRMVFTFYDLRYVLRNAPEVMTEEFEKRAMAAFSLLLDLLSLLENADLAKRQRGFHVEQEEPWEKTFNLCILLLPAVQFFVKWCSSSKNLLCKAVEATLNKFHELLNDRYSVTFTKHNVDKSLVGKDSLQLIPFDVFKDHVSVHHPIPRLLAGLILGASSYDLSINSLLQIQPDDTKTPLLLMEFSSRVIVMAVQVMAGMWKRNGYSVVNQVINYQFHYSRDTMYDKDIVLLQAMASILDPNVFLYALIYKFRLDRWLMFPDSDPDNRGEPADDALRFFISEAEEFLFLLITIFGERYTEGVGEGVTLCDSLRREIIHRLFISPLSHSEILKQFRLGDSEMEVEKLVKEVATQNRSAPGGKYMFELNPEFEKEYNPFFYHYNKTDHSKAENVYRKKAKQAGASAAMKSRQPPKPPPFCKQFQGVTRLCSCPVLHRLLHCIFQKAASPSSFWSDRLLHEALHLCTLILSDEDPADQHSLRYAATGRHGNSAFLGYLEQLQSNRRSEEHKPLLSWIIEFLVKVRDQSASSSSVGASTDHTPPQGGGTGGAPMESSVDRPGDQSSDKLKKRKAEQQRSKLMAQMSAMQKRFLEKHKQEMNDIEEDVDYHKGESTAMEVEAGSVTVTRCAVGVASVQAPPPAPLPVTCILCQEKTNDFASHESLYVQAVQVQRSSVLRPKCVSVPPGEEREHQILCARADMWSGVYTMGCGHYMHAECWKRFHVNKRQETNYHFLMPIAGVSALWHKGEFLCPLCQSFGSNVLPLLPSLHHVQPPSSPPHGQDPSSQTRSTSSSSSPSSAVVTETSSTAPLAHAPSREIALAEWVELLALAVKMAEAEDEDSMEANPPTFLDKLKEFFPDYQKPSCHFAAGGKSLKDEMTTIFSQAIYMHTFNGIPNEASSSVSLSLWKNISYTISVLEFNARTRGKFVIEMLSTRELDILKSLVRCGYETSVQPKTSELGRFCQELSNTFLLQCPAFSELASILEVDAFGMLVNLHYAATLLFANLSVPTGTLGQNSTLTSLVGVTNQILVRVATALRVLQFLLTTQPMSMDTEVTENSSPEVSVGLELQKLWSKFRSKAKMPTENPPPPYDLYVGLREFLYPFLHCSVLFLHTVTGISLVHSSSSEASTFEDICVYLGLPLAVHTLLEPSLSSQFDICRLANNWCTHPRLAMQLEGALPLPILSAPRKLIALPKVFSDMVKMVSNFKCPNRAADGDDTQAAMLCLVCGKLLCTNSYCCQREVTTGAGEDTKMVGGLIQHALSCGAGYGMAMWVVENYIVLLDATDLGHVKGCTLDPPYLDRYGEPDPGLRRGSPLWLQEDRYLDLQHMWFGHLIPQTISKEMEKNRHLVGISWANM